MSKQQMSASEIKLMLRKLDFPFCAREALTRVEQFFIFMSGGKSPTSKIMQSAMEITAEFVFCEVDRRGTKKRPFSKIQELQLMEVLCDHFLLSGQSSSGGVSESVRSYLFSALFPRSPSSPASPTSSSTGGRSNQTWEARLSLLCKLVSLAVATRNIPLLATAGAWMAQAGGGATAAQSVRLAQCLVRDYIVLVPRSIPHLKDLPLLAPLFAAQFLAAISEMYASIERGSAFSPPPDALLDMVTHWVAESSHLCLGPLVTTPGYSQRSSTPPSTGSRAPSQTGQASPKANTAAASTCSPPFAALFKWCIIAPLHFYKARPKKSHSCSNSGFSNSYSVLGRETMGYADTAGTMNSKEGEPALYSQLHLALLQAMLNLFLEQEISAILDEFNGENNESNNSDTDVDYEPWSHDETGGNPGDSPQCSSPKMSQQPRKQQQPQQPMPSQLLPTQQPTVTPNVEVISASHMRSIADEVEIHRRRIFASVTDELDAEKDAVVQLALDRLGQALQVSLATGCLYGDRRELLERLSLLPKNRLTSIVITKHLCQERSLSYHID
ncbi:integrator complex subunit 15 isoform X1 [Hetaerina americana]|uniref:integrator complex subunit 15 isoform X1 n=1 Tax=Hetaerina americana TaxID=62018 RepID=UPI003A7F505C